MSQLQTKFIEDDAVTGAKVRLRNNEALRARNAANTADVDLLALTASDVLELKKAPRAAAALPMPSNDKEYATIEFIRNFIEGKTDVKNAVQYLTMTNVTGTFSAGDADTPATLTGTAALVADGKTFGAGDVNATTPIRICLGNQTAGLQNGIYDLIAAAANSFTLRRSPDFDGINDAFGSEITQGVWFRVTLGTLYAGYEVQLTTADPITLNTTALTFVGYPAGIVLNAGDMIAKSGNDLSVDLATNGGLESTNPGNAAGQLRVKTATGTVEKDRTVKIDGSGNVVAKASFRQTFTLSSTDITNQYVDLSRVAATDSVELIYPGAGNQDEGVDYTVNYTGGASSKTRVTFAGGLATGGASALAAGEKITIRYRAFSA